MSHISQVAPPPPPPPMVRSPVTPDATKELPVAVNITTDECSWAWEYPELQKGCYLSRVCQYAPPKHCQYYPVKSILQVGPTCGLVALSMLLNGHPPAADLLKEAITKEYTLNGELFSAQYLFDLTRKHMTGPGACQLHEGPLNCKKVRELLKAGGCLIVPYDADVNHAPCLKSGHRAHWALIVGYLVDQQDRYYVLARHGKTRNLAVWSLDTLSESNANLVEFAQPKGYPDNDFLLPPDGIGGSLGLNERCILVNGLPQQAIHIRCP
ncbi:actin maturation protease [Drosophila suzukii]|uniref:Actin maturation protease n=1 Tax=Drosophila suzukii TaxID=28584 RepID=A0AB39ZKP8_DROSZ